MNTDNKREIITEKLFAEMRDTLFFQIHRIQKSMFRKGNQIFQEAKIPLQLEQFPILMTAYAHDALSQQEIAELTHRDKSSIQRTLVTLERKGFVKIVQDANDKRRNLVHVTDAGKYMAERIKELMKRIEQETFKILEEQERKEAIDNMKRIADKLENI